MLQISAVNLSKAYGLDEIFNNVNFVVNDKDKLGLVGLNGSGKTTLLNMIMGIDDIYQGDINIRKDVKLGYLKQNIHLESDKTIYEELLSSFDATFEIEKKLKELEKSMDNFSNKKELNIILDKYNYLMKEFQEKGGFSYNSEIRGMALGMGFLEEDLDKLVNSLSGGEKSRLELGKLLLSKPDILLLDEPTNHLDIEAISFLENFLRSFKGSIIVISHDRYFLDNVVNKILLLENKKLYTYNTNYTDFITQRKKDLEVRKSQYENQQKEIERQKEIIERFKNLGGSKRKRGIAQSRSREKLLKKMVLLEKPESQIRKMTLKFKPRYESGDDVLRVENLSKAFSNNILFKDISFNIYKNEKIALIGGNGTGKTSLFKIILKKLKEDEGHVFIGDSVRIGYFDQEQENLDYEKTILDDVWDDYPKLDHYEIRSFLARFNFYGDDIFKFVGDLSGGERARISLLKLMLSDANFLLMDEPTNHLDIQSKEILEDAINSYEGTCFVISHDRYFLNKIAEKILLLKDRTIREYLGNYDYFRMKYLEENEKEEVEDTITKTQKKKLERKEKLEKKELRKIKSNIRNIEEDIKNKEEELKDLKDMFYDPEIYKDHEKAYDLNKRISNLKEVIDNLTSEWLEMNEDLDEE